jgi:hypothetical protein
MHRVPCEISRGSLMTEPARRYMGMHIIVDITNLNQEDIWKALETVLCGACDTGERDCTIEVMASCIHADFDTVLKWVNGEE